VEIDAELRRRTAERFRAWPNLYWYARGKLWLDPAFPAVARALRASRLPLLDLGCGVGLLAAFLREAGHAAPVTGIELDASKVSVARAVLPRDTFVAGDASAMPEHLGDVVMLDVIHYFDDDAQQRLLAAIAARVAPGGAAYIRLTLNEPNWRFFLTQCEEWFVSASRWIPTSGWNFPRREEVERAFHAAGMTVETRPMWGATPFNSWMFVCRRAA